ncbi:MAG: hypothetical protein H6Q52_3170 [Deltaproteobacteria bacterium]|nr:hypothetical protein [Deltaproteobacteria bacterium]
MKSTEHEDEYIARMEFEKKRELRMRSMKLKKESLSQ